MRNALASENPQRAWPGLEDSLSGLSHCFKPLVPFSPSIKNLPANVDITQ